MTMVTKTLILSKNSVFMHIKETVEKHCLLSDRAVDMNDKMFTAYRSFSCNYSTPVWTKNHCKCLWDVLALSCVLSEISAYTSKTPCFVSSRSVGPIFECSSGHLKCGFRCGGFPKDLFGSKSCLLCFEKILSATTAPRFPPTFTCVSREIMERG